MVILRSPMYSASRASDELLCHRHLGRAPSSIVGVASGVGTVDTFAIGGESRFWILLMRTACHDDFAQFDK